MVLLHFNRPFFFTAKSEISTWRENSFLCVYGGQGAKPIASKNSRLSTWKKGGILSVVYIHNQCLLFLRATSQAGVLALTFGDCRKSEVAFATSLQTSHREFACCVSLGERFATHKCVSAQKNKKSYIVNTGQK